MTKEVKNKGNPKERFEKLFDELARTHNAWQVWCDFIEMSAYCIANSTDLREDVVAQREESYMAIAKKYSQNELESLSHMLAEVVKALDENSEQDFLGVFYMDKHFGNSKQGQFFTPWHISDLMARVILDEEMLKQQIEEHGYASVHDPTCGSGVMLMAFAKAVQNTTGINYQQDILFVGQDIDPIVAKMCYIQLSLLGCPGYVIIGNSLTEPVTGTASLPEYKRENIFFTPFYYMAHFRMNKPKKEATVDKKVTVIPETDSNKPDMEIDLDKLKSQSVRTVPRRTTPTKKTQNKALDAVVKFFTGGK